MRHSRRISHQPWSNDFTSAKANSSAAKLLDSLEPYTFDHHCCLRVEGANSLAGYEAADLSFDFVLASTAMPNCRTVKMPQPEKGSRARPRRPIALHHMRKGICEESPPREAK
eukprot:1391557-Amphidinium_carterae.2